MDSSTTTLIQRLQVNRMDEHIPNGIQKFLIQHGIPAATLHPVRLLHIKVQDYIWFEQYLRNAYGVAIEES